MNPLIVWWSLINMRPIQHLWWITIISRIDESKKCTKIWNYTVPYRIAFIRSFSASLLKFQFKSKNHSNSCDYFWKKIEIHQFIQQRFMLTFHCIFLIILDLLHVVQWKVQLWFLTLLIFTLQWLHMNKLQ